MYLVPKYIDSIISKLRSRDWIIHNFELDDCDDIYNIANYLENYDNDGVEYILYLDVNIYQFILNAVKKDFKKSHFEDAIALIVFCQMANIKVEPSYAVYEKINYEKNDSLLNEVIDDLNIFYTIDNFENEVLAQYALGLIDTITIPTRSQKANDPLKLELTKYSRLRNWDTLKLMILAITSFDQERETSREHKLLKFITWMVEHFMLSLVSIVFAIVYFSNKPLKKMMKFKINSTKIEKKKSIKNMTWDLYFLDRYFRLWIDRPPSQEAIFASNDLAFKKLLELSITVQKNGNFLHLQQFLPKKSLEKISKLTSDPDKFPLRKIRNVNNLYEYRSNLIKTFEIKLGIREGELK